MLFNLIGRWKGTGRKIALFIPAAIKIILVAVFVYTSWYKGRYNGLIKVLFSRAVTNRFRLIAYNYFTKPLANGLIILFHAGYVIVK